METLTFRSGTDADITTFAFGEVAAGSSDDHAFRIYNNSDIYKAEDVTVTAAGTDAIQLWLSTDNEIFGSDITLGDIAPNSSSDVFWLRRVTAGDAAAAGTASLQAVPAAWSLPVDTSPSTNIGLEIPEA